ncbi:Sir2 family protein [Corallococcus coralloides DSM 2259]|uniref:NAD-dependent protein deacetylase n=1 Tax=Corallococcus coralloides (strain ATCC 25202 / DSM 2259 / NBRC 100086 / M2) TaxID=1144275 RepID=H8MFL5_CORCM|nr:NAD-dependent protein deacetylase [Corallococcus coralloides]AFE08391.1 Sir2 family protein [Corallococcus coralloides DSM 2259]
MTLLSDSPVAALPPEAGVDALAKLLRGRRVVVLTGAGISTESGIPDYRGPETRHKVRNPIQHREFLHQPEVRQRYWARSLLGWPRFTTARPNDGHFALVALEKAGVVPGLITQNVDGLHSAAGSERVLELHGALSRVRCLACGAHEPRASLQARMLGLNPGFAHTVVELRPDGDAELSQEAVEGFRVPACTRCGGTLKPDVVFFGDNVAAPLVQDAFALVEEGDALLVVGSSLTVYSGYRFVTRAAERHMPIGILNIGESRGDGLADVRVEARAGEVLPRLAQALTRS